MRFKALIGIIAAATLGAHAQTETADTVKIISRPEQLSIIRNGNKTIVKAMIANDDSSSVDIYSYTVEQTPKTDPPMIDSDKWVMELPFMKEHPDKTDKDQPVHHKRVITGMKNVYWGWIFNYDGKSAVGNCFELGVADFIGVEWSPWRNGPSFEAGIGFGMRRYLAPEGTVFIRQGDTFTSVRADNRTAVDHSRWDMITFHVPLMVNQRIWKKLGISAGAWINFNTYSVANSQWRCDGIRYRETVKGIQQELITVDLMAGIGLKGSIAVYARWSPMNVMKQPYGPEFKSWSIGASLDF